MTTAQAPLVATDHEPDSTTTRRGGGAHKRRARLAGLLLLMAVVAIFAAGGWGVLGSLGRETSPARVGETVEVKGGTLRVDAVAPEHMATMQADKFAASGMNMSAMGMDMAPEGQRRFTADVTLAGEERSGLIYSADQFRISGEGMEETGPIRHNLLDSGTVPSGSATSASLVFQVPEDAGELALGFDGGRSISLDLPAAEEGEAHGGGQPEGDDHDH